MTFDPSDDGLPEERLAPSDDGLPANKPDVSEFESLRKDYADWDDDVFQSYLSGPVEQLQEGLANGGLRDEHQQAGVVHAYLKLIAAGIGQSLLTRCPQDLSFREPDSLLERLLATDVPKMLPAEPADRRLSLLAEIWNACDGLRQQPAWLSEYALLRVAELTSLAHFESYLLAILTDALTPRTPQWQTALHITCLDPTALDASFLPGDLDIVAPTVARVTDRLRPVAIGVLLQAGGESRWLGPWKGHRSSPAASPTSSATPSPTSSATPSPASFSTTSPAEGPPLRIDGPDLAVESLRFQTPFAGDIHAAKVSSAGFVLLSAVDSQRLWIVESS